MKKFLLFFLLIPLSFSALNCLIDPINTFIPEIQSYMGVVILLNIMIITLAYILGTSFRHVKFIVFSKDELFHLFFSIFLIFALYGIVSFSCFFGEYFKTVLFDQGLEVQFTQQYTNLGLSVENINMTSIAKNYLNTVKADAVSLVKTYTSKSINNEMFSSWVYTIYTYNGITVSTATQAYKKTYALQYDSLINIFLNPILVSITMQKLVVDFLVDFAIPVFFPLGLLLRIFNPTRQLGNMVIAFAIGCYVFLPLMYAFNASMYAGTMQTGKCLIVDSTHEAITDQIMGDCYSKGSFWEISRLIPQAFFLPNLTIAIFITFLSAVNKALKVVG